MAVIKQKPDLTRELKIKTRGIQRSRIWEHSSLISAAVIKSNFGRKGFIWLTGYSTSSKETRARTQGKSWKQKPQRNTAPRYRNWLLPGSLPAASYKGTAQMTRDGTTILRE